jgi:hypothetical protein
VPEYHELCPVHSNQSYCCHYWTPAADATASELLASEELHLVSVDLNEPVVESLLLLLLKHAYALSGIAAGALSGNCR